MQSRNGSCFSTYRCDYRPENTRRIRAPKVEEPKQVSVDINLLEPPLPKEKAKYVSLHKGPNIASIPEMDEMPDQLEVPILLKMGDNISTDEILAGGARVLPFRSNLPEISKFTFEIIDPTYYERAKES